METPALAAVGDAAGAAGTWEKTQRLFREAVLSAGLARSGRQPIAAPWSRREPKGPTGQGRTLPAPSGTVRGQRTCQVLPEERGQTASPRWEEGRRREGPGRGRRERWTHRAAPRGVASVRDPASVPRTPVVATPGSANTRHAELLRGLIVPSWTSPDPVGGTVTAPPPCRGPSRTRHARTASGVCLGETRVSMQRGTCPR